MKFISRNLQHYLVGLVAVSFCVVGYKSVSDFLLFVPKVAEVAPRPTTANEAIRVGVADLFPEGAWQQGDCKRLLTERGTLLFQKLEQIESDRWVLEPLTIVVGRGLFGEQAESPIIMNAPAGAEIQFGEPVDMMGGKAPPIKMGRMKGDVLIDRANAASPRDRLSVRTRNVRIDNQKVWTTERINMKVGNADLRGIDFTLYLAASASSATKAESPSTILDRMDLVYLEELRIPLDEVTDESTAAPANVAAMPALGSGAKEEPRGTVSVKCRNGLSYDFALDRLSLRESISMIRMVEGEMKDTFYCDTLDLSLRNPADQSVKREGALDWVDSVYATGRPVKINLPDQNFRIEAEEIDFDASRGLLLAKGPKGIRLRRGPIEGILASLAYQYDPQFPEQLGSIDVHGGGDIVVDDPEIMLRRFRWSQAFKLQPEQRTTLDELKSKQVESKFHIRVDGDVRADLSDGGSATAGSIEGLMRPYFVEEATPDLNRTANNMRIVQPQPKPEKKMTLVPEVFHALDAVSIDISQVAANMDRLTLFFEVAADYGKLNAGKQQANASNRNDRRVTSADTVRQPGSLAAFSSSSSANWHQPVARNEEESKPVARPKLSGDSVSAQLLISGTGIEPKDVSIDGNVMVEHQVETETTTLPMTMTGQSMRLLRGSVVQASGQDYLQIGGSDETPARLAMGDGHFVGPVIKAWPIENMVEVVGAGELKVPTELLKKAKTSKDDGKTNAPGNMFATRDAAKPDGGLSSIQWNSPPLCRWGGNMRFDGQTVVIDGGVQIDTELISGSSPWIASMTGDEMQVVLKKAVDISDRGSMSGAELSQISLVQASEQPVYVRAEQRSGDQATEGVHVITANRVTFAPGDGGQLIGAGPGWYRGWVMMDEKRSILNSKQAPDPHLGGQVLQGVHLTFRESMLGDLNDETLTFTGGVRTGVRKLRSWNEVVDVAQMERLAVGEMTMDCERLQFGVTPGMPEDLRKIPGMPTPWEMKAEGGIIVRTNTETRGLIEGTAGRASYESKKSWLNIEGTAGKSAFIRQTWPGGKPGFQTHSPRMLINMKTYEFQTVMEDAMINNLQLPNR